MKNRLLRFVSPRRRLDCFYVYPSYKCTVDVILSGLVDLQIYVHMYACNRI